MFEPHSLCLNPFTLRIGVSEISYSYLSRINLPARFESLIRETDNHIKVTRFLVLNLVGYERTDNFIYVTIPVTGQISRLILHPGTWTWLLKPQKEETKRVFCP